MYAARWNRASQDDERGSGVALLRFPDIDPAPEKLDLVARPRPVARHGSRTYRIEDGAGVDRHIVERPQIEDNAHRIPIGLTKQRLDVGGKGWSRVAYVASFLAFDDRSARLCSRLCRRGLLVGRPDRRRTGGARGRFPPGPPPRCRSPVR